MDETTTTQVRTVGSGKPASESVAGVVVLFNPTDRDLDNVSRYIDQVDLVIAVDNTPDPDPAVHARLQMLDVKLLPMDGNKGIAAALNAGCLAAQEAGFRWVLMLDQDSTPSEDMVSRLLMCVQQHASERIALVAPVWQIAGGLPEPTSSECVEIDYAMTSGTLLRLNAFDEIQGFREDFFIERRHRLLFPSEDQELANLPAQRRCSRSSYGKTRTKAIPVQAFRHKLRRRAPILSCPQWSGATPTLRPAIP